MASRILFEIAEYLVAAWRLAHPDGDPIPVHGGVLDEALHEAAGYLPQRLRDDLSFGATRAGFRCHELPEVLWCAQANLLASLRGPSYLEAEVQISEETARRILRRRSHDPEAAAQFGASLGAAVHSLRGTACSPAT